MAKRKSNPSSEESSGGRWKRIMAWVGGATAILSLIFGLQKLVGWIGDTRHEKQQTSELLALADMQQRNQQYPEAWATLARADEIKHENADVQHAQEDVAMKWLRQARPGQQSFSDFVKPLLPVVERGALHAEGQRKADLLAHIGWAEFLNWRDGRDLAVQQHYEDALKIDPKNPFAHAMFGHWILFKHGDPGAARQHFAAALASGREHEWVRHLQFSALHNMSTEQSGEDLLRFSNDMRVGGENIDKDEARYILWATCYSDIAPPSWQRSTTRLPPRDEIATLRWLSSSGEQSAANANMVDLCAARAQAWEGDTAGALGALHKLANSAESDVARWRAKQAVEQLTAGSRKTSR